MPNYPLRTVETFDPDAIWVIVKNNGGKEPLGVSGGTLRYFKALKADTATLGISGRWALAQWDLETGNPNTGNGGQSEVWVKYGNPGGIAVFPDGSSWDLKFTPETAARAQAVHLARYLGIPNVPEDWIKLDARWQAVADKGWVGTVVNVQDLGNGKWATDPDYADQLIGRYTKYFGKPGKAAEVYMDPDTPIGVPEADPETGSQEPSVATTFKRYDLPGLLKPAYFPDWLKVEIKLIPSSVNGWTSGQKVPASQFVSTTYHDTDNGSSSRTSEYEWARNGGRGQIGSAGSYNGIFDANGLIITQRFDELVGHAANPTGNVTSYAFEEAYGATGHERSLEVGMWVHAGILQSIGKTATDAMYQHNFWSGKNCPRQIREDKGPKNWAYVEKTTDAHIAEINAWLKAQGGGGTTTTPKPTTPAVVIEDVPGLPIDSSPTKGQSIFTVDGTDYILVNDLFKTKKAVKRQRNEKGDTFGDDVLPTATPFVGAYIYRYKNDPANPWKLITAWKSRFLLADVERVNDVIPAT